MTIKTLSIECLRNIARERIELNPNFNLFYGQNGAGKTSILEAVDLVSNGRTFRTRYNRSLIKNGESTLRVQVRLFNSSCLKIEKTLKATRAVKDNKPITKQSQLSEALPVWSIHPDSHNLVQGPAELRRKFMDKGVFHVEHCFYPAWKTYQKALRQRNYLLAHASGSGKTLKAQTKNWESVMIDSAQTIDKLRNDYIQKLKVYIDRVVAKENNKPVKIAYQRGWGEGKSFSDCVESNWDKDRQYGYTRYGPHRAGIKLMWEDQPAAEHASRGQQKLIAIVLIVAQVKMFCAQKGKNGVLLADDIFAELDKDYLDWAMQQLQELGTQTLITKTNSVCPLPAAEIGLKMFHVKHAKVYETKKT